MILVRYNETSVKWVFLDILIQIVKFGILNLLTKITTKKFFITMFDIQTTILRKKSDLQLDFSECNIVKFIIKSVYGDKIN